ncbi:TY1B-DR3, partial [Symbiodinium microadriaticum]
TSTNPQSAPPSSSATPATPSPPPTSAGEGSVAASAASPAETASGTPGSVKAEDDGVKKSLDFESISRNPSLVTHAASFAESNADGTTALLRASKAVGKPAVSVPKKLKFKEEDFVIPQLSEEEQKKYVNFWQRYKSNESLGSLGSTPTSAGVPSVLAPPNLPPVLRRAGGLQTSDEEPLLPVPTSAAPPANPAPAPKLCSAPSSPAPAATLVGAVPVPKQVSALLTPTPAAAPAAPVPTSYPAVPTVSARPPTSQQQKERHRFLQRLLQDQQDPPWQHLQRLLLHQQVPTATAPAPAGQVATAKATPEGAATRTGLVSAGSPVPVPTAASAEEAAASLVASPAPAGRLGLCVRCSVFYNQEQIDTCGNVCCSCGSVLQAVMVQAQDPPVQATTPAHAAPADSLAEDPHKHNSAAMPDDFAAAQADSPEAALPDDDVRMEDGQGNGLGDCEESDDGSTTKQPEANAERLALMLQLMTQRLQKIQPDHSALNQRWVSDPSAHLQLALPSGTTPATRLQLLLRWFLSQLPSRRHCRQQSQRPLAGATGGSNRRDYCYGACPCGCRCSDANPCPAADYDAGSCERADARHGARPRAHSSCQSTQLRPSAQGSPTSPASNAAAAAGDGLAMEAVMRFSRQKEEEDKDQGKYYDWAKILELHKNNVDNATAFVLRRRADEIAISMGLDPAYATSVASMISHNPFAKQPAWPGTPPTDADVTPPLKGKAKTPAVKQEAEGGDGSDMEVHIMESSQEGVNAFVKSWISAATNAQGQAVRLLEPLKSQQPLIEMIEAAVAGITDGRKKMQNMGTSPA